ncbi:MAG: hypothetical protein EA417_21760 [Gammaproteobacteria bacterium]|nr:MAG: hypothetical protein EA417_21760 [Gammaproteobacteria bacterium]
MNGSCGNAIERLNAECFCLPLADSALTAAVAARLPAEGVAQAGSRLAELSAEHPLFLPVATRTDLFERVRAVGELLLARSDVDRDTVCAAGVCNSFDFHLTTSGPKLIEINTNAGGAFLQPLLLEALGNGHTSPWFEPELQLLDAFATLAPGRVLSRLAIVDADPASQALYLDMRLAAVALERRGIAVEIMDVASLRRENGRLFGPNGAIDMVYNRLTDFGLDDPAHALLREAWLANEVVLAPNPDVYRTFAEKQLLIELSDPRRLAELTQRAHIDSERILDTLLPCELLGQGNAERLWIERRHYVFKPTRGYGSRGVYRGDKVSRRKWETLLDEGYLAQRFAAPSERSLKISAGVTPFKVDIRVWTHGIEPIFVAARLYSGQVMGFRNEGAGFAPILWVGPSLTAEACQDRAGFRALCTAHVAGDLP